MSICNLTFFVGFFLICKISFSQAQLELTLPKPAHIAMADALGNYYLVNKGQLIKYDSEGKLLFRFSEAMCGDIESIDVTNPLKVLVFYKETNQLIFLNQQLAPVSSTVQIQQICGQEATLACYSNDAMYWLYLPNLQQIVRYNYSNQSNQQTQNLGVLLQGENPIGLTEANQHLYLFTSQRVLIFDVFGNYLSSLMTENATNGFFYPPASWGYFNGTLHLIELESNREVSIEIPTTQSIINAILWNGKMLVVSNNGVEVFLIH